MSAEIVRPECVTAPHARRATYRLLAWIVAFATLPQLALLPLVPFGVPVNLGGFLLDSSVLELVLGLAIVGGVVAARRAKNAQGAHAPLIGAGWAIVVGAFGAVLILVAVFTFTPMTGSTTTTNPTPSGNQLFATIIPSIGTTAATPGSPYTAATGLTLAKIGATGTQQGGIWGSSNATYTANPGGYMAGGTFLERDAVTRTKSGYTFNTATHFLMSFAFNYNPSPINSVGQTFKAPLYGMITGISYTTLVYNNATIINYPVVAQQPLVNGRQDWSIIWNTPNPSAWIPACPNAGSMGTLNPSLCTAQQVDVNDGTASDTVQLDIVININGPFSYDQATSPIGKQWIVSFALGLPAGSAGAQNNYMNWIPYQLIVQATS